MLEKLQAFAENKYETNGSGAEIVEKYENLKGNTVERLEGMDITKRIVSTAKLLSVKRSGAGDSAVPPMTRNPSSTSTISKKAPPPPPSLKNAGSTYDPGVAPPPYSAGSVNNANSLANKRPPPPIPASKPKPKPAEPQKKIVVALYDFAAQAEGDLDFKAGDRIELLERTASTEDWWTGKLNGKQGVFPGNYVQEA